MREYFSPREAGTRVGLVMMATLFGMALGGWMSGVIFDLTGSYRAAFLNGICLERGQRGDHALADDGAYPQIGRCVSDRYCSGL